MLSTQEGQETSIREQIQSYLRYWPWFVITTIIALTIAFIYLRYTTPVFQTTATILVKDEKTDPLAGLSAFENLGFGGGINKSDFENEIEILKSKSLTKNVIDVLNLRVRYFIQGSIKSSEIFSTRSIDVKVNQENAINDDPIPFFTVTPKSRTSYNLVFGKEETGKIHDFGNELSFDFGTLLITANSLDSLNGAISKKPVTVYVSSQESATTKYRSKIGIQQLSKFSSVIQLTLNEPLKDKAQAILNELIKQYNDDAANDKNLVSRNTADFIEKRLIIISEELDTVESGKVDFKKENNLTDIVAEGQLYLQNASASKKKQLEVETQLELVNTMISYLQNASAIDLLPANLGIQQEGVNGLITNYNTIVLERNRLLLSATETNPVVSSLTNQLQGLKANISQSLQNAKIGLEISRRDFRRQNSQIGGQISTIPSKEKDLRSIVRQQEIKEQILLYLLQKREETSIALAVTTPKAKVVDYAYSSRGPIAPKKKIIFLAAAMLGLIIPFGIIYLKNLLDNKIRNKAFIEKKSREVAVVGEIPLLEKNEAELINKNDRSVLAESFRILRTNLQYLFTTNTAEDTLAKTVFVTSTVKGEGKTFVSVNLALTLANSGNKVLLVGADIRNPQLQRYMSDVQRNNKGVVEYLISNNTVPSDYIFSSEINTNMDIMISGAIPPNPAELWLQPRAAQLFNDIREGYDYVVVDTAPSMLVTDTFLINKYSDVMLYVMRAGYTEKRLIDFPLDNIKTGKLKNVSFVLNGVSMANFGYGNKYGYTYGSEKQSFWKKLIEKFS